MILTTYVLTLFLYFGSLPGQTDDGTIQVTGLRSDKGSCIAYFYNRKDGFPTKPALAYKSINSVIRKGICEISLAGIEPGVYAISVLHDENGNGKIDANFAGMPREGIGTSNNVKSTFGPPGFAESRMELTGNAQIIHIQIKYL